MTMTNLNANQRGVSGPFRAFLPIDISADHDFGREPPRGLIVSTNHASNAGSLVFNDGVNGNCTMTFKAGAGNDAHVLAISPKVIKAATANLIVIACW